MTDYQLIYEDKVGRLFLELHKGTPFIHCTINKWSKDIYNYCIEVWSVVLDELYKRGIDVIYASIDENDKKLIKCANMFGFEKINGEAVTFDGKIRKIYKVNIWDLQH